MNPSTVWITIIGASLVSFGLRAIPFVARGWFKNLSPGLTYFIQLCGYAIIGSMMAEAVFSPLFASDPSALTDVALRAGCTVLALLFMLRFRRQVLSLGVGYVTFVVLYLLFISGSVYHG